MQSTAEWIAAHRTRSQAAAYADFYGRRDALRWLFRFDVRYRCRRLVEVAHELGLDLEGRSVLDVGFGGGHLLAAFPRSCTLCGADVSRSAVERARRDPRFHRWRGARFVEVREDDPEDLPPGPFDVVLSSHTLEHVPDDRALLAAVRRRLAPGGTFFLFVPIEEPDYNPDHVRNYSVETIRERVRDAGFEVLFVEGSMHVNGHVWKVITIPSRRRWPVLRGVVDGLRLATLSALTYRGQRFFDAALDRWGFGPRQAFLVCRSRPGAAGS